MKTFLPRNNYFTTAILGIAMLIQGLTVGQLHAQASVNLLLNGSFESPAVPITNGNNIMGPGVTWSSWDCNNGGINIIRVQGSGYNSGANHGSDGDQYVDVANSDGYIYQSFVLTHSTPIVFSGAFSNRESGWSSYINWTGRIDVLDSTGAIVATSTTRSFITTDNMETWHTLMGSSSTLPAGKYMYRAYAGNSGHFDNAEVFDLGANTILSVKLKTFTATLKNDQVDLQWLVSEEKDMKGYELQYSIDGVNFKTLQMIPAANRDKYNTIHKTPAFGANYYRLKMNDIDGKFSFSSICKVELTLTGSATIFPNPARGSFNISFREQMTRKPATLSIIASTGRIIQSRNIASLSQVESIDISKLSPGIYFVCVNVEGEIVKQMLKVVAS